MLPGLTSRWITGGLIRVWMWSRAPAMGRSRRTVSATVNGESHSLRLRIWSLRLVPGIYSMVKYASPCGVTPPS